MKVDMYEATPEVAKYVNSVCERFKKEGDGNMVVSISLAISLCAQVFLSCGGNIDMGEQIGEAVKQGIISTLAAYKDVSKITNLTDRRLN